MYSDLAIHVSCRINLHDVSKLCCGHSFILQVTKCEARVARYVVDDGLTISTGCLYYKYHLPSVAQKYDVFN